MPDPEIEQRLERIEALLESLVEGQRPRTFYSCSEVAEILGRAEFTVREWCRHGRILAEKRSCGRGHSKEWMISAEEVERVRNEGLLPL
jgi:hypothetical protein